jgi:hypothetical protein
MPNPHTSGCSTQAESVRDDAGFFQPYSDFAKNLRTWFLAYGIGAPVLLLSNQTAWTTIKQTGQLRVVAALFLIGVALQIVEALLYKHAMWHLYSAELNPQHKLSKWYKSADWLSNSYALELLIDLGTVALFTAATVVLFVSLV